MSPEQCRGVPGEVDHRTDIYALGIILYEALCGRLPFEAEGVGEMMMLHMTSVPPPPSALREGVPPRVEELIMTALAKRRDDRFASMGEFKTELESSMSGAPARARPRSAAVQEASAVPARAAAEPVSETAVTARMGAGAAAASAARRVRSRRAAISARARRAVLLAGAAVAALAMLAFFALRPAAGTPAAAPAERATTPIEPAAAAAAPNLPAPNRCARSAAGKRATATRAGAAGSLEHQDRKRACFRYARRARDSVRRLQARRCATRRRARVCSGTRAFERRGSLTGRDG